METERSFWISLSISIGAAVSYLCLIALLARHAQPISGYASDLTQRNPHWDGWDKTMMFFSSNLVILALFGALLCLAVAVRGKAQQSQWHSAFLLLAGGLGILALFAKKLTPAFASTAYLNGLDPVNLLLRLPHGVPEFSAFLLPLVFAVVTLARTGRLPGAGAALVCLMAAAVLLFSGAIVEGHVTPHLLPALQAPEACPGTAPECRSAPLYRTAPPQP